MKLFLPTVTLVALSSCQAADVREIPSFPESQLSCEARSCAEWTVEIVDLILLDFDERWQKQFGEIPSIPRVIHVEDRPLLGCVAGYARGDEIFVGVYADPWWIIEHEATHNALRALSGDGDMNHEGEGGPWTLKHSVIAITAYERGQRLADCEQQRLACNEAGWPVDLAP